MNQFNFEFDGQLVDWMVPAPANIPFLKKNEPFTAYL